MIDIEDLTETIAGIVEQTIPDCEGACLGTSAILAVILAEHGIPTTAVCGTFDEYPHWWLETDTHRIDPTRGQFDRGPLVQPFADDGDEVPYVRERSFPSRWDRDQAVLEFARMHAFHDVGIDNGRYVLDAVSDHLRSVLA